MTPVPCAAAHGIKSAPAPGRMSEKGGCSESTWRTASQRSSRATSKLLTPMARTLPSSTKRAISPQESSMGVPSSSGQWIWKRSIRSTASRRREFSTSSRKDAGRALCWGGIIGVAGSHLRPHFVKTSGRSAAGIPAADRPLVFTKCGLRWDPATPMIPPQHNARPASLRLEVENSLRRLAVDRIDLFQIHWPDELGTPIEDSWGEMARFVDEGKVRAIGVSNFEVALLERCEAVRHVDSLQPPFSLIRPGAGADLIPWAAAHGTGVIVYSPMGSGILTDSFSRERAAAMADDDWRRHSPSHTEPDLTRNLALRDALRPVAATHRTTVSAVAVAWTLTWAGVRAPT